MRVCRLGVEGAATPFATERRLPRPETAEPLPPQSKTPLEPSAAATAAPAEAAGGKQAGGAPARAAASAAAGEVAGARADAAQLARQLADEDSQPAGGPAPPRADSPIASMTEPERGNLGAAVAPAVAAMPPVVAAMPQGPGTAVAGSTDVKSRAAPKSSPAAAASRFSADVAVRIPAAKASSGKSGMTSRTGGKTAALSQKHRQPTKTKAGAPAKVFSAGKISSHGSRARSPSPLQAVTNQAR